MEIVILDGCAANPGDLSWNAFEKLGKLTVHNYPTENGTKGIIERIGNAQIVISNKTPINKEVIEKCPNIKYIGLLSTGYNIVDLNAARERNIPVTNVPAYSTNAVAQFTIALLLEICSKAGHHSSEVHKGRWEKSKDFCFWDGSLIELANKTIGIIGLGNIGTAVAKIAKAMEMNVIALGNPAVKSSPYAEYMEKADFFAKADIISLHCPLFEETRGIINKENISLMKDGVIIINTARGPLVNEQDLAQALNSGKVYAAGVDVVSKEPIQNNNPLLKAQNCIITPHIAWAPTKTRARLINIAVSNLENFLNGCAVNVVN